MIIKIPTVSAGEKINAVVFYTSADDDRLGKRYARIKWEKGLDMISKMPNVSGIVIQSSSDAWIAITQEKKQKY